jgi:hypothetical protein
VTFVNISLNSSSERSKLSSLGKALGWSSLILSLFVFSAESFSPNLKPKRIKIIK